MYYSKILLHGKDLRELFSTQSRLSSTLQRRAFENIVGKKRENSGNQHFLLFPQCFLPTQRQLPSFEKHVNCPLSLFPKQHILDSSELKEFADDDFQLD